MTQPSQDAQDRARCSATTKAGKACRASPVTNSKPPRCAAHGGTTARIGAPPGNTNAETHGAYSDRGSTDAVDLDARIRDLNRRIERLSQYIDEAELGDGTQGTITVDGYAKLANIHGQLTSRLGRLLRDKQQLDGGSGAELAQAIGDALDMASQVLGVDL